MSMIKHRLQQKKVLLILDDVDKQEQLKTIIGGPDWMGLGSKVIITTRDKQLLACHKVEKTYEVKKLNKEDALQLLRRKAFNPEQVDLGGYVDVLNRAVTYASGLPLALEVIGSNLYGKDIEEWESALNKYARIPINDILKVLKISFDALDEEEKNVFLDIACCFKGYDLEEVNEILCAHHGDNLKHHIRVLVDKSLIKINVYFAKYKRITLHDLIEDMGKEIVRQESPKELGECSRLWFHEDVVQVLKHNKGSNKIEIIFLALPFLKEEVKWDGDAFKKMKNLKTLIIKNGDCSQGPSHLPNSLRVLEWKKYPSEDLPSGFCPNKLVICKLSNSPISSLGLTSFLLKKKFVSLTNLNFDKCEFLTQIPDISCLKCLERLSFKSCENLHRIHNSVGSLKKRKRLDAGGCMKLRSFPPLEMTSLEYLNLSWCDRLESFPEISVKMENMREMYLEGTSIKKLPRSSRNLTKFETLLVMIPFNSSWEVDSLFQSVITMPELTEVEQKVCTSYVQSTELTNCTLTVDFFLVVATWFAHVKELILYDGHFKIIPECIKECCLLEKLRLVDCRDLQEIRGIPPKLKNFEAIGCPEMTDSCRSMLLKQELHETGNTDFIVPHTPIPEWFDHRSRGSSVSFWFRNNFPELVLCLTLQCHYMLEEDSLLSFYLFINGNEYSGIFFHEVGHTHLFNLNKVTQECNLNEELSENEWNFVEVKIEGLEEGGIHILKQESRMEDIRFTNPTRKRKLEDELDSFESQNHQLLKKHKSLDMDVSGTQIVQQQHTGFLSHMRNETESLFPLLPAFAMLSLDDETNEESRSLVPMQ